MKLFTQQMVGGFTSLLIILILAAFNPAQSQVRMRANLQIVDNTGATLMDGNMTNYSATYSNAIDGYDIWKMSNFGENFGILRSTANLVIERRSLIAQRDTTFFRMWNMQQRNYRIQLIVENLHTFNLVGVIKDNYLNQEIPVSLNDTSNINFTVNGQPGSYAQNRFQLIYTNISVAAGPLPVNFTGIHASRKNNNIQLSWTVEDEIALQKYIVEYATDGFHFKALEEVKSANTSIRKTYTVLHSSPGAGDHFYRIKGISLGDKVQYSPIARVSGAENQPALNVYPNPVVNKTLQMQLNISQAGIYSMHLVNSIGSKQELASKLLPAGQSIQTVHLPKNTGAGIYRLQLTAPDKSVLIKTIHVL